MVGLRSLRDLVPPYECGRACERCTIVAADEKFRLHQRVTSIAMLHSLTHRCPAWLVLGLTIVALPIAAQTLDEQLQRSSPNELAQLARQQGDAARGAIVFFQPHLACSKCHSVGEGRATVLGPDLAKLPKDEGDAGLVEAILFPSKAIRKGF